MILETVSSKLIIFNLIHSIVLLEQRLKAQGMPLTNKKEKLLSKVNQKFLKVAPRDGLTHCSDTFPQIAMPKKVVSSNKTRSAGSFKKQRHDR